MRALITIALTMLVGCGMLDLGGSDGTNGTNGKDGLQGVDGKEGSVGPAGSAGADGSSGVDGQNGEDGTNGSNGSDGQVVHDDELVYAGTFCGRVVIRFGLERHWIMYATPVELTAAWYYISTTCDMRLYRGKVQTR